MLGSALGFSAPRSRNCDHPRFALRLKQLKDTSMKENVTDQFPKVGDSGPPVENVSGSVPVVGSTIRQNRDPGGRFKPRWPTLVRGLDAPGHERGGSNASLHRDPARGPFDADLTRYTSRDHSHDVPYSRHLDDGSYPGDWRAQGLDEPQSHAHSRNQGNEEFINHAMGCPQCAVDGFVRYQNG